MNDVLISAIFAFQNVSTERLYFATAEQCEAAGRTMTDELNAKNSGEVRWLCASRSVFAELLSVVEHDGSPGVLWCGARQLSSI